MLGALPVEIERELEEEKAAKVSAVFCVVTDEYVKGKCTGWIRLNNALKRKARRIGFLRSKWRQEK